MTLLSPSTADEHARFWDNRLHHPGREFWCAFHYRSLEHQQLLHQTLLALAGDLHGKTLLDVGCGTGDLIRFVPPDCDYHGIDISPHAVKHAQANHPAHRFTCTDQLEDADIVLACAVVHFTHIEPRDLVHAMWQHARERVVFNCWRQFADIPEARKWWRGLGAKATIVEEYDLLRGGDHDFAVRLAK